MSAQYILMIYLDFSSYYTAYIEQLDKYPWMTYTSDVADPVPEGLAISMSSFVDKNNLSDVAYNIFAISLACTALRWPQ